MNQRLSPDPYFHDVGKPYVERGPLLHYSKRLQGATVADYTAHGGYQLTKDIIRCNNESWLSELDMAGVRGRGGAGFPTGHKWWLSKQQTLAHKMFICNSNYGHAGSFKEEFLLTDNPHFVVESTLIGTLLTGASQGFICVPNAAVARLCSLERALEDAYRDGVLGPNALGSQNCVDIFLYRLPSTGVAGEETAILELMKGHHPVPRGKSFLPTSSNGDESVAAVSNLETILQAHFALAIGARRYREVGTDTSPGTMVFSLSGSVMRPGLYELPLGTSLHSLLFDYGRGFKPGTVLAGVFPGGSYNAVLGPDQISTPLDYTSMRHLGTGLGTGNVIAFSSDANVVGIAAAVADQNHRASCGKCQPCEDGTLRTTTLLKNLSSLQTSGADIDDRALPNSHRASFKILNNNMAGISYTDTVTGLDKILHLCEWYKFRGDCNHSKASAETIQSIITRYRHQLGVPDATVATSGVL